MSTVSPETLHEYYSLLRIAPSASVNEIQRSYRDFQQLYATDTMGTYGLFTEDERRIMLERLDEAYHRLMEHLGLPTELPEPVVAQDRHVQISPSPKAAAEQAPRKIVEVIHKQPEIAITPAAVPVVVMPAAPEPVVTPVVPPTIEATAPAEPPAPKHDGLWLKTLRQERGLSVEEMARLTKLHHSVINKLEQNDAKSLMARVYVQGYVRLYLKQLRPDYDTILTDYMKWFDNQ